MKELQLSRGAVALVDDADFFRLLKLARRWSLATRGRTRYAVRWEKIDGVRTCIYLHRWILDAPPGKVVDHINGNGLDNRRANLRIVTQAENMLNQTTPRKASSGFAGVAFVPSSGNWRAYVNVGNRQVSIGVWPTPELAAAARDRYVIANHPTAPLNFSDGLPFDGQEIDDAQIRKSRTETPGVREHHGAWEAYGRRDGKKIYLGRFATAEEAIAARAASRSG